MKEVLLHHVWKSQIFNTKALFTEEGKELVVVNSGSYLENAGPDFFNARLFIDGQEWAGNVEIHKKASDWYAHRHEVDSRYDNVILHVVWESDIPVLRNNGDLIPVFVLKDYIEDGLMSRYAQLFEERKWIYCENQVPEIAALKLLNWKERLYIERLEEKTKGVLDLLHQSNNDWKQVFFICLARGFGLNVNGEMFERVANGISSKLLEKHSDNLLVLESLLMGRAGLLQKEIEDVHGALLKREWNYLKVLHDLEELPVDSIHFYKLRPDNFPTIRLSQMASLFYENKDILKKLLEAKELEDFYSLFNVTATVYWDTHYVFDKENKKMVKRMSRSFIDLLLLNTVIPFLYVYHKQKKNDFSEELFGIIRCLKPEKNIVISNFKKLGFEIEDALDSQAMLELKKSYCNKGQCLNCLVGKSIVNGGVSWF